MTGHCKDCTYWIEEDDGFLRNANPRCDLLTQGLQHKYGSSVVFPCQATFGCVEFRAKMVTIEDAWSAVEAAIDAYVKAHEDEDEEADDE